MRLALFLLCLPVFGQVVNPKYQAVDPPSSDPGAPSWGSYQYSADFVAPFNYEFVSLVIGGHSFHQSSYTPRNSFVSSSSALLIGWNTPTDDDCIVYGCRGYNGQAGITVSMLARNTTSLTVGLMLDVSPGVDGFHGVWGFNTNISNNFHKNNLSQLIAGGEINIGLDDIATDVPSPGVRGQSIGLAITESSQNKTGKRVTAAIGIGTGGTQNFHHGFYFAANPAGITPMDDLIYAKGPINTAIDLHEVKSGAQAVILPAGGGLSLGARRCTELVGTSAGTVLWCSDCIAGYRCAPGGPGALAVSTGNGYRCY